MFVYVYLCLLSYFDLTIYKYLNKNRIRHKVKSKEGVVHDAPLVRKILADELIDILSMRQKEMNTSDFAKVEARYRQAFKVSQRWIANYVNLDFRSLGSYSHSQLEKIAQEPDALAAPKL
jgi:hypothetical protein